MAKVICQHVTKQFGAVKAVDDFNVEIKHGEFMVIVGPSGCGKSTSLRMIAGLEQQTEGNIFIGDTLVNDKPPRERNIAMVFQNYALYPHMDVYNNMAFALQLRNTPKEDIDRRVKEAAEILSITQYLNRKPRELSGGQRQRVALGRAIVREPDVFLMDEPLSNLDAKLRVQMRTEIAKLHNRLGVTMIYVTHDQVEAMTMADRIVVMKDGLIQQVADPQTLYDHPANRFVAGFIGTPPMNFLNCRVVEQSGAYRIQGTDVDVAVPAAWLEVVRPYAGQEVVLGVRPENIEVGLQRDGKVTASVEVVEPLGSETFLNVRLGGQGVIIRVNPECRADVGQVLDLNFHMSKAHLFNLEGATII